MSHATTGQPTREGAILRMALAPPATDKAATTATVTGTGEAPAPDPSATAAAAPPSTTTTTSSSSATTHHGSVPHPAAGAPGTLHLAVAQACDEGTLHLPAALGGSEPEPALAAASAGHSSRGEDSVAAAYFLAAPDLHTFGLGGGSAFT